MEKHLIDSIIEGVKDNKLIILSGGSPSGKTYTLYRLVGSDEVSGRNNFTLGRSSSLLSINSILDSLNNTSFNSSIFLDGLALERLNEVLSHIRSSGVNLNPLVNIIITTREIDLKKLNLDKIDTKLFKLNKLTLSSDHVKKLHYKFNGFKID